MTITLALLSLALGQELPARVYAFPPVVDDQGIIAPYYTGQDGQWSHRAALAWETLARYPWAEPGDGIAPAPHYVFSGAWRIDGEGAISIPELSDWDNGDLGQRAAYILLGLADLYRYTGCPTALAHMSLTADHILDNCLTPADHPWPGIPVSVPVKGKPYGRTDPHGFIQLDIVAELGLGMLETGQLTGEPRHTEAAFHWARVLAERCDAHAGVAPWPRYANPEDVSWEDHMTGGVVFILEFLDRVLAAGCPDGDGALHRAREAGAAYLRDVLLPRWTEDPTWGRNYWDWQDAVQAENVTEFVVRYLMRHPEEFPNWRCDARNILGLFLHRTGVATTSNGGLFAGAWAFPESSSCCGRSLWYGPLELAPVWAEYGVRADDAYSREIARRMTTLATYDCHDTGVVEDNIDGGAIVAGSWFKIAHPMALRHVLAAMAWLPAELGATGEDHFLASEATVTEVSYEPGRVCYRGLPLPPGGADVLRLSFLPDSVTADGARLPRSGGAPGYSAEPTGSGDWILRVRRGVAGEVLVCGAVQGDTRTIGWTGTSAGESTSVRFAGTHFRLLGEAGPEGGLAEVWLDGTQLLAGIDCWSPVGREGALLWRSGLPEGEHELRIAALGRANPRSQGTRVALESLESGGPSPTSRLVHEAVGAQRVILGYAGRSDYLDSEGHAWRPATELIARFGDGADAVRQAWWERPRAQTIAGTADPELYRHGFHAPSFTLHFTVSPGVWHVRLKLAESRRGEEARGLQSFEVNGVPVFEDVDVGATAGGPFRAVDLVVNGIEPVAGMISIGVHATTGGEAILQAVEVAPGEGGEGARPVTGRVAEAAADSRLRNGGFEEGGPTALGRMGASGEGGGWRVLFAGARQSYAWIESAYAIHPDWGLPEFHEGKEALRTHTDGEGHTLIYQDARVTPGSGYRASAWALGRDLHGQGFAHAPGDQAVLRVQQLSAEGAVLAESASEPLTEAGPWRELTLRFEAVPGAARARFLLDTSIAAPYNEGHVTWDSCELVRVEPEE